MKKLNELKGCGPLVTFEVSATLLAIYMVCQRSGGAANVLSNDIFYVDPGDDYVGAELLFPPKDASGNDVFLNETDLTQANKLADSKVLAMYQDAADKPRSLLLDATTSAVTAQSRVGLFDKGRLVQQMHPHAVILIVSGGMIKWWTVLPKAERPEDFNGHEYFGKGRVVSNVISVIDSHYPKRPIFAFGYSQMQRGIPFRSKARVPSHFVLFYKEGMPLCRVVQAAGRAMGEQHAALRKNGFEFVTMLTQPQDYDAICKYPAFLKAIKEKMDEGISLSDALHQTFSASFQSVMGRDTGAKKLKLQELIQTTLKFEPTRRPIGLGAAAVDTALGMHGHGVQRAVLEVLLFALSTPIYEEEEAMTAKEVLDELDTGNYNKWFGDESTDINLATLKKTLNEMCKAPAHRAAVLEDNGLSGKFKAFYVNEEGLDALPGYAGEEQESDEVDKSEVALPLPISRQASLRVASELEAAGREAAMVKRELAESVADPGFDLGCLANAAGAGPSGVSNEPAPVNPSDADVPAAKRPRPNEPPL